MTNVLRPSGTDIYNCVVVDIRSGEPANLRKRQSKHPKSEAIKMLLFLWLKSHREVGNQSVSAVGFSDFFNLNLKSTVRPFIRIGAGLATQM